MQALSQVPFEVILPRPFYTVKGVPYGGAVVDVQVTSGFSGLLDDGRRRTQKGWADYRKETGWGPGSGLLIYALLGSLYNHRDGVHVEKLRRLFDADFRHWMMTATGITYRSSGIDLVAHDAGAPFEKTLEARLVGPDGYVDSGMGDVTQALFGDGDPGRVAAVYMWVTGRTLNLWRMNSRPEQDAEKALVLGGLGGFGIGANGNITYDWPARGVRIAPQNSTESK